MPHGSFTTQKLCIVGARCHRLSQAVTRTARGTCVTRARAPRRAQSYAVLRQRYLTGGEALLNNWNTRFLETRATTSSQRRRESRAGRVLKRGTKAGAKGGAGSEGKAGEGEEAGDGQARSGSGSGTRGGTLRAPRWASPLRSILDVTSQVRARLGALPQQRWVADAGCRWGACSPSSAVCRDCTRLQAGTSCAS